MKGKVSIVTLLLCTILSLNSCGQNAVTSGSKDEPSLDSSVGSSSFSNSEAPLTTVESFFKNGPVCVQDVNGLWGYIDIDGNYVIEPKYQYASRFSTTGLAMVEESDTGLYGYINTTGRYVIDSQFLNAYPFSQGLALVMNSNYGLQYIDETGTCVIEIPYEKATSFSNDRAFVYDDTANGFDGGWAMIDLDGKLMTDAIFSQSAFTNGETVYWADGICCVDNRFINNEGEIIAPKNGESFAKTGYFFDGYASVKDPESYLWGYIDINGDWVVPPQFSQADIFRSGVAVVRDPDDSLMGIIDDSGNWVVEPQFPQIRGISDGKFLVSDNEHYLLQDFSGTILEEYDFPNAVDVSIRSDVIFALFMDRCEIYDLDGSLRENCIFDTYRSLTSTGMKFEYGEMQYDGYWGVMDANGDWLIPAKYLDFKI